jgi:predicted O-methyltransferase YrrM
MTLSEMPIPAAMSKRVVRAVEALDAARSMAPETNLDWLDPSLNDDGWALAPDALRFLAALMAELRPRHVLEFGSGVSTLVLAHSAASSGDVKISSVEHDPFYAGRTAELLRQKDGEHLVFLQVAPLVARVRAGELHPIYLLDRAALASERPADIILIDGPPAALGGRTGMLYQALDLAQAGTIVLLDDAARRPEQEAVTWWEERLGDAVVIGQLSGFARGLAAMVLVAPTTARIRTDGQESAV